MTDPSEERWVLLTNQQIEHFIGMGMVHPSQVESDTSSESSSYGSMPGLETPFGAQDMEVQWTSRQTAIMDLFIMREDIIRDDNGYHPAQISSLVDGLIGVVQRMREEIHSVDYAHLPDSTVAQLEDLRELSEWAINYQFDENSEAGSLSSLSPPSSPGSVSSAEGSWSPVVESFPGRFSDMAGENMNDRE